MSSEHTTVVVMDVNNLPHRYSEVEGEITVQITDGVLTLSRHYERWRSKRAQFVAAFSPGQWLSVRVDQK